LVRENLEFGAANHNRINDGQLPIVNQTRRISQTIRARMKVRMDQSMRTLKALSVKEFPKHYSIGSLQVILLRFWIPQGKRLLVVLWRNLALIRPGLVGHYRTHWRFLSFTKRSKWGSRLLRGITTFTHILSEATKRSGQETVT
jgi:hypothetical protein